MGSGMGIPSIGLYSYELYKFYGVETIIRIGSAGSYTEALDIFDTILVTGAYSESTFAKYQSGNTDKIQHPDKQVTEDLKVAAKKLGIDVHEGYVFSADQFYFEDSVLAENEKAIKENNLLAAEMESFGLFSVATALGKRAACMLTVSDIISSHKETTSEERRSRLINMIKIALEAARDY